MRRINVLVNLLSSNNGGGETYRDNLLKYVTSGKLDDFGINVYFLVDNPDRLISAGLPRDSIIVPFYCSTAGLIRVIWEFFFLRGVYRRYCIDVTFVPYQVGFKVNNVILVLMFRNMEPYLYHLQRRNYSVRGILRNAILRRVSTYCLLRADRVISVSHYATARLKMLGVEEKEIRTVHHGVVPDDQSFCLRSENFKGIVGGSYILTVGSLLPYRRCEDIIRAFDIAAHKIDSSTRLVIVGGALDKHYYKKLMAVRSRTSVSDRTIFTGRILNADVRSLLRNCSCVIFSTEIEAFPNTALEAMACGAYSIAADIAPLPEVLGDSAIFYPPRDIVSLASRVIERFSCPPNEVLSRKIAAIERSRQYNWDRSYKETFEVIRGADFLRH